MFAALSFDPLVSIGLGPLSISPHGLFTGIGVLVGAWFLLRDVARAGYDGEAVTSILTRAVVAALVGARLAYVVNHWSRFDSLLEVLRVWEGGASLLGGLTAALIVAVFELRRRQMPVLVLLDLAAPWFLVGIAVGRIGDVIIADHLGDTTSSPLGFRCPDVVDVDRCGRGALRAGPAGARRVPRRRGPGRDDGQSVDRSVDDPRVLGGTGVRSIDERRSGAQRHARRGRRMMR